jgi:hypothetical protein
MAFVRTLEIARGYGVGECEKGGAIPAFFAQSFGGKGVLVVEHRFESGPADVPVTWAINGIGNSHIIRGDTFGDGAGSTPHPEEPPDNFLSGPDFRECSITPGIEVYSQCFGVGIYLFTDHRTGIICGHWALSRKVKKEGN